MVVGILGSNDKRGCAFFVKPRAFSEGSLSPEDLSREFTRKDVNQSENFGFVFIRENSRPKDFRIDRDPSLPLGASEKGSIPEQIRHLHKEYPAIVDERTAGAQKAVRGVGEGAIEVLHIAVVADVNRRPGMHQVSEKNVSVEVLGVLQGGQGRISNICNIL